MSTAYFELHSGSHATAILILQYSYQMFMLNKCLRCVFTESLSHVPTLLHGKT